MVKKSLILGIGCLLSVATALPANAAIIPVAFTKLTGVTGGTVAGTAVFRADLSGLGLAQIQSITIMDSSFGLGGAPGEFSGFDLDAIILSNSSVATAAAAQALVGLAGFDYSPSGTIFTPGAQRAPLDPKLFGTDASGNNIDNTVATLGVFDGESIAGPGADGFVSMGDGGKAAFNLMSPISTTNLFLYIGEVGDNGEVAAGSIFVSDRRSDVPEPTTLALWSLGAVAFVGLGWRRRKRAA